MNIFASYMGWNIMVHVMLGLLGSPYFNLTPRGILYTLAVTTFTQGLEIFNMYMSQKRSVQKVHEAAVKGQKYDMKIPPDIDPKNLDQLILGMNAYFKGMAPKLFLRNVLICASITLGVSTIGGRFYQF